MDIAGADAQDVTKIVDAVVAAAWPLSLIDLAMDPGPEDIRRAMLLEGG